MSETQDKSTMEELLIRLTELERANARMGEELAALRTVQPTGSEGAVDHPQEPVLHSPAKPRRRNRRGMLRKVLVAAAAVVGAGTLLETNTGIAHADNVGNFSSSVASTPAVTATGTNSAWGINAVSDTSYGIYGSSGSSNGIVGSSGGQIGVYGVAYSGGGANIGVYGLAYASSGTGVEGWAPNGGYGMHAIGGANSTAGPGINVGLFAESDEAGVYVTSSQDGVLSFVSGSGVGVYGDSASGYGVSGYSGSGIGVYANTAGLGPALEAVSAGGIGLHAIGGGTSPTTGPTEAGVYAQCSPGYGVYALSNSGTGVYAQSSSGQALVVNGHLQVKGNAVGQATLAAGKTSVTVNTSAATTASIIMLTPLANPRANLWVTRAAGNFTIHASAAPTSSVTIAYLIVN